MGKPKRKGSGRAAGGGRKEGCRYGNDQGRKLGAVDRTTRKRGSGGKEGVGWKGLGPGGLPRGPKGSRTRNEWVRMQQRRAARAVLREAGLNGPRLTADTLVAVEVPRYGSQCNAPAGRVVKRWKPMTKKQLKGLRRRVKDARDAAAEAARAKLAKPGYRLRWRQFARPVGGGRA